MSRSFILEAHHPFCLAEPTDITENQVGYSFTKKVFFFVAISDTNLQLCHLEYLQAIRVLANAPYLDGAFSNKMVHSSYVSYMVLCTVPSIDSHTYCLSL